MEYHNDKDGTIYARVRFGRQKAVNVKFYKGYWYYHFDDLYGTKITLAEDEFGDFTYIVNNDLPKIQEEIQKKQEDLKKKRKRGKATKKGEWDTSSEEEVIKERKDKKKKKIITISSSSESTSEESQSDTEIVARPQETKLSAAAKSFLEAKEKKTERNQLQQQLMSLEMNQLIPEMTGERNQLQQLMPPPPSPYVAQPIPVLQQSNKKRNSTWLGGPPAKKPKLDE